MRPGDYLAIALEGVEQSAIADPEFLAQHRDKATKITVREGQAIQVNLKIEK